MFGMEKVTKYTLELPVKTSTFQWIMNKKTYDSMSDRQKKAIDDHCSTDMASKFAGPWIDYEAAGVIKLRTEPGRETYMVTEEQIAEWKKSTEPAFKQWADDVRKTGADPDTVLKELQSALNQFKGGF